MQEMIKVFIEWNEQNHKINLHGAKKFCCLLTNAIYLRIFLHIHIDK